MKPQFNWKKWKVGLCIAVFMALFNAGSGLVGDMGWKSFVAVLCSALVTNLGNFLYKHPIEEIEDTVHLHKPEDPKL